MQGNFSTMKNLICHNYISFAKAIFPRSRCEFGREQKTPSRSSRTSQPSEPNTASSIILSFGNVKKGSECRGSCTDTPTRCERSEDDWEEGLRRVEETARHWLHRETYLPPGHLADQPPSSGFNFPHFWAPFLLPPSRSSRYFSLACFHLGLPAASLVRSANFFAR